MLINSFINADISKLIESAYFIQKLFEKDFMGSANKNLSSFLNKKFDTEDFNFCRRRFDKLLSINMSKLLKQGDNIVILNKLIAGNIKKAEISEICCSNFDNKSLAEYIYDGSEFYPVPNLNYMVMNTISLHNKKISGSNQIVNGITK